MRFWRNTVRRFHTSSSSGAISLRLGELRLRAPHLGAALVSTPRQARGRRQDHPRTQLMSKLIELHMNPVALTNMRARNSCFGGNWNSEFL